MTNGYPSIFSEEWQNQSVSYTKDVSEAKGV
jgi:hypothetical protein